jgi:hypothetical protein
MKEFKLKTQSLSNFGSSIKLFQLWISPSPKSNWRGRFPFFKSPGRVTTPTSSHSLSVINRSDAKHQRLSIYFKKLVSSKLRHHKPFPFLIKQLVKQAKTARYSIVQIRMNVIGTCISHFDSNSNFPKQVNFHHSHLNLFQLRPFLFNSNQLVHSKKKALSTLPQFHPLIPTS